MRSRVVNQKGVVERDLTKKESYFVFQSYWAEKPMVHIYGHTLAGPLGQRGRAAHVKRVLQLRPRRVVSQRQIAGDDGARQPELSRRWTALETSRSPADATTCAWSPQGEVKVTDEIEPDLPDRAMGQAGGVAA